VENSWNILIKELVGWQKIIGIAGAEFKECGTFSQFVRSDCFKCWNRESIVGTQALKNLSYHKIGEVKYIFEKRKLE
jgi:hypothetical protein